MQVGDSAIGDQHCETCRDPLAQRRERWSIVCDRCERAVAKHNAKLSEAGRQAGDSNFVYHELAHHVVLFGRKPRSAMDWRAVERMIDPMTVGRAQMHELRTLALQFVAYEQLGWQPSIKTLVEMSWFGLVEVRERDRGRSLMETRADAEEIVADFASKVSARNVRTYVGALNELRMEAP